MTLPSRARAASWLLAFILPADDVQHVVGDLEEELASSPWCRGRRWYWSQLARSLPRLLWVPIRRTGWVATFGVALAACTVQAGVELGIGVALYQMAAHEARWPAALGVATTLASLVVVSRTAARVCPGSATAVAAIAAGVLFTRVLLAAAAGHGQGAALAGLVLVPASAFTGGWLACKIDQA